MVGNKTLLKAASGLTALVSIVMLYSVVQATLALALGGSYVLDIVVHGFMLTVFAITLVVLRAVYSVGWLEVNNARAVGLLVASSLLFGVAYAFSLGVLVYRPGADFSELYGVGVPSVKVVACCSSPGNMPTVVAYITNELGLVLKPISLVLLMSMPFLVGLNVALVYLARSLSNGGLTRGEKSLVGAGMALTAFSGCATCSTVPVGLVLISLGAVALTPVLASISEALSVLNLGVLTYTALRMSRGVKLACQRNLG